MAKLGTINARKIERPNWWQVLLLVNLVWLYVYGVFITENWGSGFAVIGLFLLIALFSLTFARLIL